MTFSMSGMIGAAVGLLLALITYLVVMPLLARDANPNAGAIRAILLADFLVLGAVGYYIGQMFG